MSNERSHMGMGMGHEVCPICGTKHTETVLLDMKLRPVIKRDNLTGISLCPEHAAMATEYLALVEVNNDPARRGDTLKPHEAKRTGNIAHVRRTVIPHMFNMTVPDTTPFVYVDVGVIEKLRGLQPEEETP